LLRRWEWACLSRTLWTSLKLPPTNHFAHGAPRERFENLLPWGVELQIQVLGYGISEPVGRLGRASGKLRVVADPVLLHEPFQTAVLDVFEGRPPRDRLVVLGASHFREVSGLVVRGLFHRTLLQTPLLTSSFPRSWRSPGHLPRRGWPGRTCRHAWPSRRSGSPGSWRRWPPPDAPKRWHRRSR